MVAKIKDTFNRSDVVEWMNNLGMLVPAARLRDCGEGGRGWVGYCPEGHEKYVSFACEQRICPKCSHGRSLVLGEKLTPAIMKLIEKTSAVYGLKHITLGTDVNIVEFMQVREGRRELDRSRLDMLREKVMFLRGCVAALFRYYSSVGYDDKGRIVPCGVLDSGFEVLPLCLGFAIGIEFGMKAGSLHFHILCLSKFIPQATISHDWELHNRSHGSYCFIQAVGRGDSDVAKSIGYVTKYVTKPLGGKDRDGDTDLTYNVARMALWCDLWGVESVIAAMAYVFKGVRRLQTYGAFFALEFEDEEKSCCEVCGLDFFWVRELDYIRDPNRSFLDSLKTLKTNNFCVVDDPPPDCVAQLLLF